MKIHQNVPIIIAVFGIVITFFGCKKFVEVDPPINSIIGNEIFKSDLTAASVLNGIYSDMSNSSIFSGRSSLGMICGLYADELKYEGLESDILNSFYNNNLTRDDAGIWLESYSYIYRINAAIEGLSQSNQLSSSNKAQLLGEAKFLRALVYFYLVNLYGDIPLLLTTDIKTNSIPNRSAITKIYDQIIEDLLISEEQLNEVYLDGAARKIVQERVRPNKAAASSLLARVYLFLKRWTEAEREASKVISNSLYKLEPLTQVFLNSSEEAIWQLQPVNTGLNTLDATVFILKDFDGNPMEPNTYEKPYQLSVSLNNSFEQNDQRKESWVDSVIVGGTTYRFPSKYKIYLYDQPRKEYLTVFRLAEQYLIRAEARAKLGKIIGPESASLDINIIRNRAGLGETTANSLEQIDDAILKERQHELFTEFGHRWFDIRRSNKSYEIMTLAAAKKFSTWQTFRTLFPIPVSEIQKNPSLKGRQNPGYPEN